MSSRCYQEVKCPKAELEHIRCIFGKMQYMAIWDIVLCIQCGAIDGVKNVEVAPNRAQFAQAPNFSQ